MKKLIQFICILMGITALTGLFTATAGSFLLPNEYTVMQDAELDLGEVYKINKSGEKAVFSNSGASGNEKEYNAEVSVLGLIPVKTVKVNVTERKKVEVCGSVFGLRIYSDGVTVVDTDIVETVNGDKRPSFDAGIMKGDIILSVDGEKVYTSDGIADKVNAAKGNAIEFNIKRGNDNISITVTPAKDKQNGAYRAGLWLRDSAAGIGTMTFYDPETKVFAGLGHSVCDIDTGLAVNLRKGDIITASINAVYKGGENKAGEISGTFGNTFLGNLSENGDKGVYGNLEEKPVSYGLYPVAEKQEVKTGPAELITSIDNNGPKKYSMEILSIESNSSGNKNMVIKITDSALLSLTGGIIQGMSGSPIIQDGMLVGAVTHVFLNDNTKGYAIYADTMLNETKNISTMQNAA